MATVFTSNLRLALPTNGTEAGTWGDTVNNGITTLVDTAITGTASITMTAADYTLTTANGATDEARAMFITATGTPGAARNIICPSVSKLYFVYNNTTGGFAQTFKTSAGTGVSVPNGAKMMLRCDGTNVVEAITQTAANTSGNATTATTATAANGLNSASTTVVVNGATAPSSGQVLTATSSTAATWQTPAAGVSLSGTNTWTGAQTFTNSLLKLLGSSTGATTFTSDNASATNYTLHLPAADDTLVALAASQTLTNKTISAGTFTDGYTEEVATANTSTAYTIDLANGSLQILTLTGNCTYTFPTATAGKSFTLLQKQDATGSRTVTWPASVKWPASTAPTLTSTASKGDKFVFTADGTYWWGSVAGQNYL